MVKSLVCLLYIVCMVVYLEVAPNSMFWFAFNIISMLMFSAMTCYFLASKQKISANERLLFWYMFGVNAGRAVYTSFCTRAIYMGNDTWIKPATHIFVILVVFTFFLFLIYLARQKE